MHLLAVAGSHNTTTDKIKLKLKKNHLLISISLCSGHFKQLREEKENLQEFNYLLS